MALSKVQSCIVNYVYYWRFVSLQVFKIAYCDFCDQSNEKEYQRICGAFVDTMRGNIPELCQKLKIHLFLHLTESMMKFGPTSSFNTERYMHT